MPRCFWSMECWKPRLPSVSLKLQWPSCNVCSNLSQSAHAGAPRFCEANDPFASATWAESTCNQFLAQVLLQLPQVPLIDWKPKEAVVNPFWHGLTSVQPHWSIKPGEGVTPRRETGYTMCATYFIFLNKPSHSAFRYNNFHALLKKKCLLLFDALL